MRMPEPRLRLLFSFGGASPKKRLKNSSMGSLAPPRPERGVVVEMLTTTGIAFLAIAANEGGLFSSAASPAAATTGTLTINCGDVGNDAVATAMITSAVPEGFLWKIRISYP